MLSLPWIYWLGFTYVNYFPRHVQLSGFRWIIRFKVQYLFLGFEIFSIRMIRGLGTTKDALTYTTMQNFPLNMKITSYINFHIFRFLQRVILKLRFTDKTEIAAFIQSCNMWLHFTIHLIHKINQELHVWLKGYNKYYKNPVVAIY